MAYRILSELVVFKLIADKVSRFGKSQNLCAIAHIESIRIKSIIISRD